VLGVVVLFRRLLLLAAQSFVFILSGRQYGRISIS
jgi:hypothetical protein